MVLYLTHDQTESWNEGGGQVLEVEETIVEDLDRLGSIPPITVLAILHCAFPAAQHIPFRYVGSAASLVILCRIRAPPLPECRTVRPSFG